MRQGDAIISDRGRACASVGPEAAVLWVQRGNDLLGRTYLIEDYQRAGGVTKVAAMVFMECLVDPGFL